MSDTRGTVVGAALWPVVARPVAPFPANETSRPLAGTTANRTDPSMGLR